MILIQLPGLESGVFPGPTPPALPGLRGKATS